MDKSEKVESYYKQEHHFREGINKLRELALLTEAEETYKWSLPVYTIDNKNVFGICRFKDFFGVWFFNGAFLKDTKNVLRNSQEGKTKAMRHWNFTNKAEIDASGILAYMKEAIQNQKEGKVLAPSKKQPIKKISIPKQLKSELQSNPELKVTFDTFSISKQKEFCEYIEGAKQETTKLRRLNKIILLIRAGRGLNDKYR